MVRFRSKSFANAIDSTPSRGKLNEQQSNRTKSKCAACLGQRTIGHSLAAGAYRCKMH